MFSSSGKLITTACGPRFLWMMGWYNLVNTELKCLNINKRLSFRGEI
jgi:hypothetical protein